MTSNFLTRREVSLRLAALLPALGFAGRAGATAGGEQTADKEGISRNCECIHQEVVIKASRASVYAALTDEKQFSKVTDAVMPDAATSISREVGGAFSTFGGVIQGRHIEMVPGERLVQAWREKNWAPGVYSIVKFQLNEEGSDTRLVFDQTAIPQGDAGHLAPGWYSHYWEPLQKYLT
jgi:uncharacterized protein YndB with AHSA1/START domain